MIGVGPNPVTLVGPLAFVGLPTVDGRRITELRVDIGREIPVLCPCPIDPAHDGPVGRVDRLQLAPTGTIHGALQVRREHYEWLVDKYGQEAFPVGIDTDVLSAEFEVNGVPTTDFEKIMAAAHPVESMVARLTGVTLQIPPSKPAWASTIVTPFTT